MKKISTIDMMKGVSIVLVVIGHACVPSLYIQYLDIQVLYILVNAVHMPVFFYLSGYLYKSVLNRDFSYVIQKKAKRLLVPYIGMSTFVYVMIYICRWIPVLNPYLPVSKVTVLDYFMGIIWYGNNCDKHLWFLYVLFVIMILYWNINKVLVSNRSHMAFAVIMLLIGEILLPKGYDVGKIFYYYFFFHIGVKQRIYLEAEHNITSKQILGFIIALCAYVVIYVNSMGIHSQLVWGINPIIGVLGIVFLRNTCAGKDNRWMQYIGQNSMGIYIWHQPFITSGTVMVLHSIIGLNRFVSVFTGSIFGIGLPLIMEYCRNAIHRFVKASN